MELDTEIDSPLEVKHFFNGAALYSNGAICASWSPVGLAFKLPETDVSQLINDGRAKPLKYFPKGHIKNGYVLFEDPERVSTKEGKKCFRQALAVNNELDCDLNT